MSAAEQPEWKYIPAQLDVETEYSASSLNQDARFNVYTFANPHIDPEKLLRQELGLTGAESILDVGCGSGGMLFRLREAGHFGPLTGIDISEDLFYGASYAAENRGLGLIDFRVGNAECLELPDNSMDVSTALFMLYHCDPIKALRELQRVTKPGGTIVVSTSGPLNKFYHRAFEELLAADLDCHPAPRFNQQFDTVKANYLLPRMFRHIKHIPDEGYIDLTNKPENSAAREAFELSIDTMKTSMIPYDPSRHVTPSEWKAGIKRIWDIMDEKASLDPTQSFIEFVQRDYYFCTNPEK